MGMRPLVALTFLWKCDDKFVNFLIERLPRITLILDYCNSSTMCMKFYYSKCLIPKALFLSTKHFGQQKSTHPSSRACFDDMLLL